MVAHLNRDPERPRGSRHVSAWSRREIDEKTVMMANCVVVDSQITLFESQGMAMQDLVIAAELTRLARAKGVGSELDFGA
jgi:ornithine cyclodeaminase/alanine dehydrogenase-like protein (mu-crystallin family)